MSALDLAVPPTHPLADFMAVPVCHTAPLQGDSEENTCDCYDPGTTNPIRFSQFGKRPG